MGIENVFQNGPYLAAALLCERVLVEKDGVKSLIRVVSRVTSSFRGTEVPEKMPPIQAKLWLFLAIKTGDKSGVHEIKVHPVRPDKSEMQPLVQRMNLEPPDTRTMEFAINLNLILDQEGAYSFNIYFVSPKPR